MIQIVRLRSLYKYHKSSVKLPPPILEQAPSNKPHSNIFKYTRYCKDLQIPRYRIEFAKKGFHYAALTLWNDTPAEIRELPTLDRFKKQLKTHLKS